MRELLKGILPGDSSRQATPWHVFEKMLPNGTSPPSGTLRVLDLGCGSGSSKEYFKEKNPNSKWVGVDIASSPEVDQRDDAVGDVVTFDGIVLPFLDNQFDVVFSVQVFEHVSHPRELLKEACRVLRPGGFFIGSVSHLEPYHSHSLWNYTPYGFKMLIEESGMKVKEIRPGIDVLTMILSRMCRDHRFFSRYWKRESPLNKMITLIGGILRKGHTEINLIKLLFCGQFVFLAQKTDKR